VRMMSNIPMREVVWAGAICLVGCMLPKFALGQDCNNNGVPDVQDVDPTDPDGDGEVLPDCDGNGVPDPCEATRLLDTLLPPNPSTRLFFGSRLDSSGDTAVVTQSYQSGVSGSFPLYRSEVVVYDWDGTTWQQSAVLVPPGIVYDDDYATSIAIDGDVIAVGAPGLDGSSPYSGGVFIFERIAGQWTQTQIVNLNGTEFSSSTRDLGDVVALSGDILVASTIYDRAAYVFERENGVWGFVAELTASIGVSEDSFGKAVTISNGLIAIGSPEDNGEQIEGLYSVGSVFLYEKVNGEWIEVQKLTAPDARPSDCLGSAVAIDGDTLAASALDFPGPFVGTGSIVIFEKVNGVWQFSERIVPEGRRSGDRFGRTFAVADGLLVASAPGSDLACSNCGMNYIFSLTADGWKEQRRFVPSGFVQQYGSTPSWSLEGERLIAGFPAVQEDTGMVQTYQLKRTDCDLNGILDECELATLDCNNDGRLDSCEPSQDDCDENGVLDECDIANCPNGDPVCSDCNQNGVPDGCEVETLDCNANGVPDDCDIANCADGDASCGDCNFDGVPDGCEMVEADCNGNLISDECELPIIYQRLPLAPEYWNPAAIAMDDDLLVLGNPSDSVGAYESGALHVFERVGNTWGAIAKIKAPIIHPFMHFGGSELATQDDVIIAGASSFNGDEEGGGIVFVFDRVGNEWNHVQTIERPTQVPTGGGFGRTLAVAGDRLLISDRGSVGTHYFAGRVHAYQRVNGVWLYETTIQAEEPRYNGDFGQRIWFTGDTAVIRQNDGAPFSGDRAISLYRVSDNGWQQIASNDDFQVNGVSPEPYDVEFDGQRLIIGNREVGYPPNSPYVGAVDIFEQQDGNWHHRVRLKPPVITPYLGFGGAIGYSGNDLLIGRAGWSMYHYRYANGNWGLVNTFAAEFGDSQSRYRYTIICEDGRAVANAISVGLNSGYTLIDVDVVSLVPTALHDCDGNEIVDECDPDASDCDGNGVVDECELTYRDCDGNFEHDQCQAALYPVESYVYVLLNDLDASPGSFHCIFDMDRDGRIDGRDIPGFVELLLNN